MSEIQKLSPLSPLKYEMHEYFTFIYMHNVCTQCFYIYIYKILDNVFQKMLLIATSNMLKNSGKEKNHNPNF